MQSSAGDKTGRAALFRGRSTPYSLWRSVGAAGNEKESLIQPYTNEDETMATWREKMDELVKELQQDRDELRVKAALGKAELKEELAELDAKFDDAKRKAAAWADRADDQMDDIMDEAK